MSDSAVEARLNRVDKGAGQMVGRIANQVWDRTNGPALAAYHKVLEFQLQHARTIDECRQLVLELEDFYREALTIGRNQSINLGYVLGQIAGEERGSAGWDLSTEQMMRLMGEEPLSPSVHRILAGVTELVGNELVSVA